MFARNQNWISGYGCICLLGILWSIQDMILAWYADIMRIWTPILGVTKLFLNSLLEQILIKCPRKIFASCNFPTLSTRGEGEFLSGAGADNKAQAGAKISTQKEQICNHRKSKLAVKSLQNVRLSWIAWINACLYYFPIRNSEHYKKLWAAYGGYISNKSVIICIYYIHFLKSAMDVFQIYQL